MHEHNSFAEISFSTKTFVHCASTCHRFAALRLTTIANQRLLMHTALHCSPDTEVTIAPLNTPSRRAKNGSFHWQLAPATLTPTIGARRATETPSTSASGIGASRRRLTDSRPRWHLWVPAATLVQGGGSVCLHANYAMSSCHSGITCQCILIMFDRICGFILAVVGVRGSC